MGGKTWFPWQEKLFNPGKLSQIHYMAGDGRRITCWDCHRRGEKVANSDCQRCHDEQWFETQAPVFAQSHRRLERWSCLKCHYEHKGYDIVISKPFRKKEHLTLPPSLVTSCMMCHLPWREVRHPYLTNYRCLDCHSYDTWKREPIDHASAAVKPKAVSPTDPYAYCLRCHKEGHHFTEKTLEKPDPVKQCRVCHWRKTNTKYLPPGYDQLGKTNLAY